MAKTNPTGWNPTPEEKRKLVLVAGRIAKGGADPIEFLERLFPYSSETLYRRAVKALPAYPVNDLFAMVEIDERFGDFVDGYVRSRELATLSRSELENVLVALPKFVDRCRGIRFALRAPAFAAAIDVLVLTVLRGDATVREREALDTLARLLVPNARRLQRAKAAKTRTIEVLEKPLGARLLAAAAAIKGLSDPKTQKARLLATRLPSVARPERRLAPTEEEADLCIAAIARARQETKRGPLSAALLVRAALAGGDPKTSLVKAREAARKCRYRKAAKGNPGTKT